MYLILLESNPRCLMFQLVLLVSALLCSVCIEANNLQSTCDFSSLDNVDPLIGSGGLGWGYGALNPGPGYPRAPIRVGPDTTKSVLNAGFEHFSGYNYEDDTVRMFSHTHFVGSGINGLGNFGVMPMTYHKGTTGDDLYTIGSRSKVNIKDALEKARLWSSPFEKSSEKSSPGQYSVYLEKPQAQADLVATGRFTAMHRYTWASSAHANMFLGKLKGHSIILDVCHAGHTEDEVPVSKSVCKNASVTLNILPDSDGNGDGVVGSFDAYVENEYGMFLHGEITAVKRSNGEIVKGVWDACSNGGDGDGYEGSSRLADIDIKCQQRIETSTTLSSKNGILAAEMRFPSFAKIDHNDSMEITIRIGLSFISNDMAKLNLQKSASYAAGDSFDEAVARTRLTWCDELSFLSITTADSAVLKTLATASYRSKLTPAVYSETGGVYNGFDLKSHNIRDDRKQYNANDDAVESNFYSDYSLWDTFRSQNPWLLLTDEPLYIGILRSFQEITQQQGAFPKWTTANYDNGCMIGVAGASGVLEAALSGYTQNDFNIQVIQESLQTIATVVNTKNGRGNVTHYLKYGYVSQESDQHASSHTVTFAFDDYILAKLSAIVAAATTGDISIQATSDGKAALLRSENYRHIFDSTAQIICPRSENDGPMACPKKPQEDFEHYQEGNALHWTYFVPHNITGLISLYGNDMASAAVAFEEKLDVFFEKHVEFQEKVGSLLPNPYFWPGNEVTMLTPYLYIAIGSSQACAKTQYWTRQAVHMHFTDKFNGLPGNDDYAAMSTWVLSSSLGLYPLAGSTDFFITSPAIDKATIRLDQLEPASTLGSTPLYNQQTINIIVYDNNPKNVYIAKLLVNGIEYKKATISRSILRNGPTLEFFMSPTPGTSLCPV